MCVFKIIFLRIEIELQTNLSRWISHNLRKVQSLRIATPRGVVAMMVDEEQKRWEDWRLREKTTPAANTSNDALALHALDGQ
ncbi:hypothetical protein V6N13_087004 [Hibiscus sabdariffa]